jgi:hypothetical protein
MRRQYPQEQASHNNNARPHYRGRFEKCTHVASCNSRQYDKLRLLLLPRSWVNSCGEPPSA